jgi:hypothetical protein
LTEEKFKKKEKQNNGPTQHSQGREWEVDAFPSRVRDKRSYEFLHSTITIAFHSLPTRSGDILEVLHKHWKVHRNIKDKEATMYSTIHCNALCNTQLIDFSIKRTNEKLSEKGSLPVSIYIGLPYRDKIHFGFVGWPPEAIGNRPTVKGKKKK